MVTDMLQLVSFDLYALFDPSSTLYFVTPLVAMKFYIPDILDEPFSVCTSLGESVLV